MTDIRLGTRTSLPSPPSGWFDYGYSVLMDGRLAFLRTDIDYHDAYWRWWQNWQNGDRTTLAPTIAGRPLRISTFDSGEEQAAFEIVSPYFPLVDRLADGRWLLVESRAESRTENGYFLDHNGMETGRFVAGDGIEGIACAPDGSFWISYFDEGIYGGDQDADGRWPVSSAGLAHFSADGAVLWRFNEDNDAGLLIDDCYALSLEGTAAWICPYSDFHVIRIHDGRATAWRNRIHGAAALTVDTDHALLAGGYDQARDRLALLALEAEDARLVGETAMARVRQTGPSLLRGRDGILHLVQGGEWTRFRVDEVRAFFTACPEPEGQE